MKKGRVEETFSLWRWHCRGIPSLLTLKEKGKKMYYPLLLCTPPADVTYKINSYHSTSFRNNESLILLKYCYFKFLYLYNRHFFLVSSTGVVVFFWELCPSLTQNLFKTLLVPNYASGTIQSGRESSVAGCRDYQTRKKIIMLS